jgi:gamma-glutamyl:cysteine ligase YbdK (ATP-grasp superfamily)
MSRTAHLGLFEGYGIEAEYMIVDRQTLAVRPIADKVLAAARHYGGRALADDQGEIEFGDTGWSNELVLHVVELKTDGPTADLAGLPALFQRDVERINAILAADGAMLMPTAMHPFMQPHAEMKLWPHGNSDVYEAYNRIFDCRGHGWSNLQSVHINLPFKDDDEFGRLHAAIRLALPLLPALAASSPIYEGKASGRLDSRLEFYRQNQRRIPVITGQVIPEAAFSRGEYDEKIFQKIFEKIRPHDPAGILQHEWLNSRGAIARFDRHAIEIRVLDIQESPLADLAVVTAVVSLVKALVDGRWVSSAAQKKWPTEPLAELFTRTLATAEQTVIDDRDFLLLFGLKTVRATAGELWRHIVADLLRWGDYPVSAFETPLRHILERGPLARRILAAVGPESAPARVTGVYRRLCDELARGGLFDAG